MDRTTCCCTPEEHDRARGDDAAWSQMKFVGFQDDYDDRGRARGHLELRNCPSGSTLARRL